MSRELISWWQHFFRVFSIYSRSLQSLLMPLKITGSDWKMLLYFSFFKNFFTSGNCGMPCESQRFQYMLCNSCNIHCKVTVLPKAKLYLFIVKVLLYDYYMYILQAGVDIKNESGKQPRKQMVKFPLFALRTQRAPVYNFGIFFTKGIVLEHVWLDPQEQGCRKQVQQNQGCRGKRKWSWFSQAKQDLLRVSDRLYSLLYLWW